MAETKNMTVGVSFPGLDKKSAPVRSLANFIAENSSLYFRKTGNDVTYEISDLEAQPGYNIEVLYLSPEPETNVKVYVSGTLGLATDISGAPEDLSPVIFDHVEYEVRSSGSIEIMTPYDIGYYEGWDNLTVSSKAPELLTQDNLEELAENQGLATLNYQYTYVPGADSPSYNSITLEDTSITSQIYLNGTLSNVNVGGWPSTVILANKEITVVNGESGLINISADLPGGCDGWDNLVVTLSPIDLPELVEKNAISCNAKLNTNVFSNRELSIVYTESISNKDYPIKASGDYKNIVFDNDSNEYTYEFDGLKVVAKQPGIAGNNLRIWVGWASSDPAIYLFDGDTLLCDGGQVSNFGYGDEYDELNNIPVINDYVKFIYTEYSKYYCLINTDSRASYSIKLSGGADTGGVESYNYKDGILECDTSLCKANTSLSSYKLEDITTDSDYGDLTVEAEASKEADILSVSITPKINGKVNTNINVMPNDELFNEDGFFSIPLNTNKDLESDFQFRTCSFVLEDYDTESDTSMYHDVFYKIGICPIDGKLETRDVLVSNIKQHCLEIGQNWNYYPIMYLSLISPRWQNPSYKLTGEAEDDYSEYSEYCVIVDWKNELPTVTSSIISLCTPLINRTTGELEGYMYMKLFNNNGSEVNSSQISGDTLWIYLRMEEDDDDDNLISPYEIPLAFKDYKLNSGYIQPAYPGKWSESVT